MNFNTHQDLNDVFQINDNMNHNVGYETNNDVILSESINSISSQIIDEMTDTENNMYSIKEAFTNDLTNNQNSNQSNNQNSNQSNNQPKSKESKYGNDEVFEAFLDRNFFLPIASSLIDPLKNIGFTPNGITYISTIFTFMAIYYLHLDNRKYAVICYAAGYLFDCIDGRMARRYNMVSKYGMALDLVSDNVSNFALIAYLVYSKGFNNFYIYVIFIMTYMIGISYGLVEAISSYRETGSDNFYERRKEQFKDEKGIIFDLYLLVNKLSYTSYKTMFKEYNEKRALELLESLKEFGPGNYCALMSYIIYNI